jgi:hypothetical protein
VVRITVPTIVMPLAQDPPEVELRARAAHEPMSTSRPPGAILQARRV